MEQQKLLLSLSNAWKNVVVEENDEKRTGAIYSEEGQKDDENAPDHQENATVPSVPVHVPNEQTYIPEMQQ